VERMGRDEAIKFWEFFEIMPEKVQLDYMNSRFGELAGDISRDWEDYKIEYDDLKRLKAEYDKNKKTYSEYVVDAFYNEDYNKLEELTGLKCSSQQEFERKYEELKKRIEELNQVE